MKFYVQLPISGRPINQAMEEATMLADKVRAAGHEAFTPFDLHLPDDMPSQAALSVCIEALFSCDALLLHPANRMRKIGQDLPSRGCMAETAVALSYGMPLYEITGGELSPIPEYNMAKAVNPLIMSYAKGFLFFYDYKENEDGYDSGTSICGEAKGLVNGVANSVLEGGAPSLVLRAAMSAVKLYEYEKNNAKADV